MSLQTWQFEFLFSKLGFLLSYLAKVRWKGWLWPLVEGMNTLQQSTIIYNNHHLHHDSHHDDDHHHLLLYDDHWCYLGSSLLASKPPTLPGARFNKGTRPVIIMILILMIMIKKYVDDGMLRLNMLCTSITSLTHFKKWIASKKYVEVKVRCVMQFKGSANLKISPQTPNGA